MRNRLFVVDDGEQALDFLYHRGEFSDADASPRPDLILLDLNMPKLDGRSVLKVVKQDPGLRSIPVVVLTTSSQEEDILRSYELGVNSFIAKPAIFDELVSMMKVIDRYWFGTVILPPKC